MGVITGLGVPPQKRRAERAPPRVITCSSAGRHPLPGSASPRGAGRPNQTPLYGAHQDVGKVPAAVHDRGLTTGNAFYFLA